MASHGFSRIYGQGYTNPSSPVAKFAAIHVLLALAAQLDLEVHALALKTEFINNSQDDRIYMHIPLGLLNAGTSNWLA